MFRNRYKIIEDDIEYKKLYRALMIAFICVLVIPLLSILLIRLETRTYSDPIIQIIIVGIFFSVVIIFKAFFKVFDLIVRHYVNINDNYKQANYEKELYYDKFIRSEKLVTMGRFASGIAHEIGNPLSSIMSSIDILKEYPMNEKQRVDYYDQILRDSQKIDMLLQEFLDFRKQENRPKTEGNINSLIKEAIDEISEDRRKEGIDLHLDLSNSLPMLIMDPERMKIVFVNIIQNAYQAIENDGYIHIRTIKLESGIRIRISDSGAGIEESVITQIFDPFFTTKEVGAGFGLGLFMCSQIITQHHGTIKVDSTHGQGTIFTIDLFSKKECIHD